MTKISVATTINQSNHVQNEYTVDPIFFTFPSKQRPLRFVNGTASERTILAGTLVGIVAADQTLGQPVASDAVDGSEIPMAVFLYDRTIPAGAAEEIDALVGINGAIYEDKVILEKVGDTLDTLIVSLNQSIRYAWLNANSNLKLEKSAKNISNFRNEQV